MGQMMYKCTCLVSDQLVVHDDGGRGERCETTKMVVCWVIIICLSLFVSMGHITSQMLSYIPCVAQCVIDSIFIFVEKQVILSYDVLLAVNANAENESNTVQDINPFLLVVIW